jgi:N-acetylmuramoyl-L-alanine amidase
MDGRSASGSVWNNRNNINMGDNMLLEIMTTAEILARVLIGEARSEGRTGMECVATVAINRAKAHHRTVRAEIMHPSSFYGLKPGLKYSKDSKYYILALDIAKKAISGQLKDKTGGALYFINPKHEKPFRWCKIKTFSYKNHDFYK